MEKLKLENLILKKRKYHEKINYRGFRGATFRPNQQNTLQYWTYILCHLPDFGIHSNNISKVMEKQPELFPKEKLRVRKGQFATEKQKSIDDRIHRAKITELKNASLERQIKNLNYQIEALSNHINQLKNGSN